MLRWIIRSSVNFRLLIVCVALVAMFVGVTNLRKMPFDILPEFSEPYVEVQTEALGLSAVEVEQLITVPLEADLLNGVAWLKTIRSKSIPGLSSIVLEFDNGTDVLLARQMVQERLTQAAGLPNVSKPPVMMQPLSSANRVMQIGLTAKDVSPIDMSVLTRWTIRPRLMGVPGVANVSIFGLRNRQLHVQVDPRHLKEKGVTLNQVIKTAGDALWVSPLTFLEASTPGTGGWVDTPNQRLGIRHLMPITKPDQLASVALSGMPLTLKDVATVVEDHQPLIGDAVINDGPGLMIVVEKFPWANTLDVTKGVEKALESLKPGLAGIEVNSNLFRPASFVENAQANLSWALPTGGVLAVLAFFAFFFNWRIALISTVAVVSSVLAAALVLFFAGFTLNMMVLAGLAVAIGVIIDDAIVDSEYIMRRLRQRSAEDGGKSAVRTIVEASLEMRRVILFATFIVLLAVAPVYFIEGLSGSFLKPLAGAYALAVVASMLVALTVTPALSVMLLAKRPLGETKSPLAEMLRGIALAIARPFANTPAAAYAAVAVLLVAGAAAWPQLGQQSLIPSFRENDLLIEWEGPPGTSRQAMNRIVSKATAELRAIPGVGNVSAHVGRAILSDEIVDVNSSELWVNIDSSADYDETIAKVKEVVDHYPGLRRDVMTYLKERTREAVTGEDEEIVVRIYGQDIAVLREKAAEVQAALAGVDGVVDPKIEQQIEEPSLEIKPNLAKARQYGLKPGNVRRAAATLLSGIDVGLLFEDNKVFDVVVWGKPEIRDSLTSINELLLDTPSGEYVELQDVADVKIVPVPTVVEREGVARRIDITANAKGRDIGSIALDIDQRVKQISFPLEYHAEVLGEYAERQAAERRTMAFGIAAAIGIFLLLQAAFGSWRLAAVTFVALPAALVGGILAAYTASGIISLGSLAGLLAVFAIAARNIVVLIRHFQNLENEEGLEHGLDLVLRGVKDRSVSILMTAVITALAVLPLVLSGTIAGHEILHPMAVVILGGLVTSTLVSLVVIPALYLRFGAGSKPELSLAEMETEAN